MRGLRIITLILFILTGVVKSVKADDSGNNAIAGVSLIGVSVLLVYDILSAPASAERYNKSLTSMLPVIKESRDTRQKREALERERAVLLRLTNTRRFTAAVTGLATLAAVGMLYGLSQARFAQVAG